MRQIKFKAWAIDLNTEEGHGLAGRYFFGTSIPEHMEGCRKALFATRSIARAKIGRVRQAGIFPNARVVRVGVTIQEEK